MLQKNAKLAKILENEKDGYRKKIYWLESILDTVNPPGGCMNGHAGKPLDFDDVTDKLNAFLSK